MQDWVHPSEIAQDVLLGSHTHVSVGVVFQGLTYEEAGLSVDNAPYTIWQLLCHMQYWQEKLVKHLRGIEEVSWPERSVYGWVQEKGPTSEEEWSETVVRFLSTMHEAVELIETMEVNWSAHLQRELDRKRRQSLSPSTKNLEKDQDRAAVPSMLQVVCDLGSHTNYHLGQIVLLRRLLGLWPPPDGGASW
ncbi:hypothetical protein GF324_00830 [bacterium]|nr:hypothetical protein [bacterium]